MTEQASNEMIDMAVLETAAPLIRTVAHPLRLRILDYLAHQGASNVTQIVDICGVEQAVVSQNLRILKDQGILTNRREGNFVFYELKERKILYLLECIRNHEELSQCGDKKMMG